MNSSSPSDRRSLAALGLLTLLVVVGWAARATRGPVVRGVCLADGRTLTLRDLISILQAMR